MSKMSVGDRVIYRSIGWDVVNLKGLILELDPKIKQLIKIRINNTGEVKWVRQVELTLDKEFHKPRSSLKNCECGAAHTTYPNHHLDWCPEGDGKKYTNKPIKGWDTNKDEEVEEQLGATITTKDQDMSNQLEEITKEPNLYDWEII